MSIGRILVVGASGFVGRKLVERLGARAVPTFHRRPVTGGLPFDLTEGNLPDLPADITHAVILSANANPDACAADPSGSQSVNVDGIRRLLDTVLSRSITPVFTSSEAVFDGEAGNYIETDIARPLTLYGRQKREVESYLTEIAPGASLILRLARVYGSEPGDGTLFTAWLPALSEGRVIRCAADQRFSPMHVDDVVASILALIDVQATGVVHLAGPDSLDRLSMLRLLIAAFETRHPFRGAAESCSIADFPALESRPRDITMCIAKLQTLTGLAFVSLAERCAEIVSRWKSGTC